MLTRPADFAAIQAHGTSRSHPLMTARFLRTGSDGVRFGLATGRALGERSSAIGLDDGSGRRSG